MPFASVATFIKFVPLFIFVASIYWPVADTNVACVLALKPVTLTYKLPFFTGLGNTFTAVVLQFKFTGKMFEYLNLPSLSIIFILYNIFSAGVAVLSENE